MNRIFPVLIACVFASGCAGPETVDPPKPQITLHVGQSQADVLSTIGEKPYSMTTDGNVIIVKWADTFSDCSIGDPTHCTPSRQITFTDGKLTGYTRLWENVSVTP